MWNSDRSMTDVRSHKRSIKFGFARSKHQDFSTNDNGLTLFHGLRNNSDRKTFNLRPSDIDESLSSELGQLSGLHNVSLATPPWSRNEQLLAMGAEKNEYNWLITPPATPLFPSLDKDSPPVAHTPKRVFHPTRTIRKVLKVPRPARSEKGAPHVTPLGIAACEGGDKRKLALGKSASFTSRHATSGKMASSGGSHIQSMRPPMLSTSAHRSFSTVRHSSSSKPQERGAYLKPFMGWDNFDDGSLTEVPSNLRTTIPERPTSSRGSTLRARQLGAASVVKRSNSVPMDGEKAQCRQGSSSNRSCSSAKQEYSDRFARMEFVIHPADKDTKTKGRYQRNASQHINTNPKLQKEVRDCVDDNGERSSEDAAKVSDAESDTSEEACVDILEDLSTQHFSESQLQNCGLAGLHASFAPTEKSSTEFINSGSQQGKWPCHQLLASTTKSQKSGDRENFLELRKTNRRPGTIDGGIGDRKVNDPHGFNDDAMALEEPDVQVKKVISMLKIDAAEVTDLQQSGDQDKLSHDAAEETLTPFHENRQQSRNVNMQSTQLEPQQNGSARYSGVPKFDKANESFDAAIGEEDIHDHNLAESPQIDNLAQNSLHFDENAIAIKSEMPWQMPNPIHGMTRSNDEQPTNLKQQEKDPAKPLLLKCQCSIM
ncbi:hypothetical protein GOP47_0016745 [Adiantum capillus-veneris]|uniref:Uncharacterized protein n=1 Tax=Adiantum capillus-veneris TaxID=13818 RepID=A0A9D4UIE0_ADICA|nr:hypothetical protein GOP47_0016745 [Adiantum capillus-veneris]